MERLVDLYPALRALWVVWFFILFLGMVWLVMRPSRRKRACSFSQLRPTGADRTIGTAVSAGLELAANRAADTASAASNVD